MLPTDTGLSLPLFSIRSINNPIERFDDIMDTAVSSILKFSSDVTFKF